MDPTTTTFILGAHQETGQPNITCRICGRTSYNPNDIKERYCGFCHQFHEFMGLQVKNYESPRFLILASLMGAKEGDLLQACRDNNLTVEKLTTGCYKITALNPIDFYNLGAALGQLSLNKNS